MEIAHTCDSNPGSAELAWHDGEWLLCLPGWPEGLAVAYCPFCGHKLEAPTW